jgi:hypothetical protein
VRSKGLGAGKDEGAGKGEDYVEVVALLRILATLNLTLRILATLNLTLILNITWL